jgi:hypothetical protein
MIGQKHVIPNGMARNFVNLIVEERSDTRAPTVADSTELWEHLIMLCKVGVLQTPYFYCWFYFCFGFSSLLLTK